MARRRHRAPPTSQPASSRSCLQLLATRLDATRPTGSVYASTLLPFYPSTPASLPRCTRPGAASDLATPVLATCLRHRMMKRMDTITVRYCAVLYCSCRCCCSPNPKRFTCLLLAKTCACAYRAYMQAVPRQHLESCTRLFSRLCAPSSMNHVSDLTVARPNMLDTKAHNGTCTKYCPCSPARTYIRPAATSSSSPTENT